MSQKKIGVSQTKSIATVQAATMGHQTYVIPFDTDAQLKNVLDVLKLHNSHPSGYTDEFVRYNEGQEFTRLEVGEELEGATVVAFKAGKAYRCPRYGPTLSRVVLVSNGGGRSETFAFLKWHLRSALPDVYVNGFHAVDAYAYDYGMDKRFVKNSGVRVENARIGLPAQVTDEVREANLIAAYTPRPAKYTTRTHGGNPTYRELLAGLNRAEKKKRTREERDVPPYVSSYATTVDGWVVEDQRFPTQEGAEAYAKTIRPAFAIAGAMAEQRSDEAVRNQERFLRMREVGKAYWTAGGGTRFWLTEEGVAERRAEGKTLVPATIEYEEEGQASGTEWKKASVADIEGMLSIGQCIILHNC